MSSKTALLLGATGETGREVLKKLVTTPEYGRIVTIGRRLLHLPQENEYKKVEQRIVNFDNLSEHAQDFSGVDVGFCCLGTTSAKAAKEGWIKVDHDYVLNSAEILKSGGCSDFHLLTGKGSNPNSWFVYPRTKGEVEEAVRGLGFDRINIYRPGIIKSDRKDEGWTVAKAIIWLANWIDGSHFWSVPVSMLAKAMVKNSLVPSKNQILEHYQIVEAANM